MISLSSLHHQELSWVGNFQPVSLVELVFLVLTPPGVTVNQLSIAVITVVVVALVLFLEGVECIRLACAVVSLAFTEAVVSLTDVAVAIDSELLVLLGGLAVTDQTK